MCVWRRTANTVRLGCDVLLLTSYAQVRFTRRLYTHTLLLYYSVCVEHLCVCACMCDRCNDGTTARRGVTDRSAHSSVFIIYPLLYAHAHECVVNFIDRISDRPNFSKNDTIHARAAAVCHISAKRETRVRESAFASILLIGSRCSIFTVYFCEQ